MKELNVPHSIFLIIPFKGIEVRNGLVLWFMRLILDSNSLPKLYEVAFTFLLLGKLLRNIFYAVIIA